MREGKEDVLDEDRQLLGQVAQEMFVAHIDVTAKVRAFGKKVRHQTDSEQRRSEL